MTNDATRWGLIGATSWADHTFAPAVTAAEGASLHAVLSSSEAHARAFCERHGAGAGHTDLGAFLADPELDAVWVASPAHMHKAQAIAALEAGKHVLCEKPMALDTRECRAMVDAAEAAGLLLGLGHHMRQHPSLRSLHDDWTDGQFGKPVYGHAAFHFSYPEAPSAWRQAKATSGGWAIGDIGPHLIDLALWFFGEIDRVDGHLSSPAWGLETDDHALVVIHFKNGAAATISASTGAPGAAPRLEVHGSEGFFVADGFVFGAGGTITTARKGQDPKTEPAPAAALYASEVENFGQAIRGAAALSVTGLDGLRTIEVIERARGY